MTGEDTTSDRDGHGMGDERSGDAAGRPSARLQEPVRGQEHGDGSVPGGGGGARGGAPVPGRQRPYDEGVPEEERKRAGGQGQGPGPGVLGEEPVGGGRRFGRRAAARRGPGVSPSTPDHGNRTATGPEPSYDDGSLAALLAVAIRGESSDGDAERRAVAAFRAARDAGAHRARTRRRDDWRPRTPRRRTRSLKATLSVLLASLTLGGVAYAAIGSAGGGPGGGDAEGKDVRPGVSASSPAESHSSARSSASAPAERPPAAKDTLAHCRVYEKLRGRSKALDAPAFQRLVTAAGGEANVSAYCAALTDPADAKGSGNGKGAGNAKEAGDVKPGKQNDKASGRRNADGNKSKKQ
ncbi:hypothetical protein [Streptomyces sp. NPDC003015]